MIGARPSLDTEGAREVEARDGGTADLGVGALEIAGVVAVDIANDALGARLRLRLIIVVSSFLNVSRSVYAVLGGEVNVKL